MTKKPYIAKTIVTNTSGTVLELQILMDIPQGTIPLKSFENTQILNIILEPYVSKSYERYFYGPEEGTFSIYPNNACRNSSIIS